MSKRITNKDLDNRLVSLEGRFDGLETRFDTLGNRFDGLETRFDGLEIRLGGLESQNLGNRMTSLEGQISEMFQFLKEHVATKADVAAIRYATLDTVDRKLTTITADQHTVKQTIHKYHPLEFAAPKTAP